METGYLGQIEAWERAEGAPAPLGATWVAAHEAWADAALGEGEVDPERLAVSLASGIGGVTTLLGDVKNSPIVEKKTAPFAIGFISYSF